MRIALEFFGPIQDRLGGASSHVDLGESPATPASLIEHLAEKLDGGEALRNDHLRIALNDRLIGRHDKLQLAEGDRVAFLSPFSGGMMPAPIIHLTGEPLVLGELDARLPADSGVGAVASFTGRVRADDALSALELTRHPVLTSSALQRIGETAIERFGLAGLLIAHRYGRMAPGEPIVHIVALAAHRRAALDATAFTIDVLKTEAPFWKREWHGEAARWVETTSADQEKAGQWLETGR